MNNYKCVKKLGPYDGPHQKNLLSYFFENDTERVVWHCNKIKDPKFEIGQCYFGIITTFYNNKKIINYKKSRPYKIQLQLL
jgi:hypothetical protein